MLSSAKALPRSCYKRRTREVERPGGRRSLGAQVAKRPEHVSGPRQIAAVKEPGEAEVSNPEVPSGIDQEVGWLDVAVQHAALVGVLQRLGRLEGEPSRAAGARRRRGLRWRTVGNEIGERAALDELHGVVVDSPLAADGVDRKLRYAGGSALPPRPAPRTQVRASCISRIHGGGARKNLQSHPAAE